MPIAKAVVHNAAKKISDTHLEEYTLLAQLSDNFKDQLFGYYLLRKLKEFADAEAQLHSETQEWWFGERRDYYNAEIEKVCNQYGIAKNCAHPGPRKVVPPHGIDPADIPMFQPELPLDFGDANA